MDEERGERSLPTASGAADSNPVMTRIEQGERLFLVGRDNLSRRELDAVMDERYAIIAVGALEALRRPLAVGLSLQRL